MELHEYPRPANDTGIGVHWTVGFASAIGIGKIRDIWIPELKALGVKWVKIFNHDGAIDFAELLLSEGLMPIVRIFRSSPNPSTLDVRDVVHLDSFIRAGVRYFEFNSEPDRDSEWKGGRVPANGLDLVVENTIANVETILERGGMPGIPAVSNGSRWDLVGQMVAKGRKDLFRGPVWHAIHNYARNRPLDYPYDNGNQEGTAYSQRFYEAVAGGDWGEDPWRGRSLAEVNRLRVDRRTPGANISDDNACWLAYGFFDARNRKHLGRSIPILSTECGYLVGEDIDPRYPATTPDLHMAQTLEACRIMMGSSTRFQPAPDYYFCSAFWLIGNNVLGSSSNWWEHHAWYSDKQRKNGNLPIVQALKAEPKKVRQWQNQGGEAAEVGARVLLHGTVSHAGDYRTVVLEKNGQEIARATLDTNSRYNLANIPAGNYALRVPGTALEQPVSLPPDQTTVQVNLDLAQTGADVGGSVIQGVVRGGAGTVVTLLRASDGEDWVTMTRDDGTFRFVELAAGTYRLHVQNGDSTDLNQDAPLFSAEAEVTLDGHNEQEVELTAPGWGYIIEYNDGEALGGAIHCLVPGYAGLQVQAQLNEWQSEPVETGSAPQLGQFACAIENLEAGYYTLRVRGDGASAARPGGFAQPAFEGEIHLQAHVQVDHKRVPLVQFVYHAPEPRRAAQPNASSIHGRIIGGYTPDKRLYVWLTDQMANRREQLVGPDCTFAFDQLAPGLYSVEVSGHADEARRADIALDGRNTVHVELMVPVEETLQEQVADGAQSIIAGRVPEGAGKLAKLVDSVGNELKAAIEPNHTFCFERLPADVYSLSVEGGFYQNDLTLDGVNGLEIVFHPLEMIWEHRVSPAGSMPGYSVIRVEVEGMRGLPVYIWKDDWQGMMRRTGSKPEYGECSAEFSPLGPGIYMVEPEGLDTYADVELTGLEVVWVDFRQRAVPVRPHEVRLLAPGTRALATVTVDSEQTQGWKAPRQEEPAPAREEDEMGRAAQSQWDLDKELEPDPRRDILGGLRLDDWAHAPPDDWLSGLSPKSPRPAEADEDTSDAALDGQEADDHDVHLQGESDALESERDSAPETAAQTAPDQEQEWETHWEADWSANRAVESGGDDSTPESTFYEDEVSATGEDTEENSQEGIEADTPSDTLSRSDSTQGSTSALTELEPSLSAQDSEYRADDVPSGESAAQAKRDEEEDLSVSDSVSVGDDESALSWRSSISGAITEEEETISTFQDETGAQSEPDAVDDLEADEGKEPEPDMWGFRTYEPPAVDENVWGRFDLAPEESEPDSEQEEEWEQESQEASSNDSLQSAASKLEYLWPDAPQAEAEQESHANLPDAETEPPLQWEAESYTRWRSEVTSEEPSIAEPSAEQLPEEEAPTEAVGQADETEQNPGGPVADASSAEAEEEDFSDDAFSSDWYERELATSGANEWASLSDYPSLADTGPDRMEPVAQGQAEPALTSTYIYLAEAVQTLDEQLALLRYVAEHGPGIGQELEAAQQADLVLIIAPSLDDRLEAEAAESTAAQGDSSESAAPDDRQESSVVKAEDDLGDFSWGLEDDDDEAMWPDWSHLSDDEPDVAVEPETEAGYDIQSEDDSFWEADFSTRTANIDGQNTSADQPTSPAEADADSIQSQAASESGTPATSDSSAPETSTSGSSSPFGMGSLYSAWINATRKRDGSTEETSGETSASDSSTQSASDSPALHDRSDTNADNSLSKGNQDNRIPSDTGAILQHKQAVLAQVEALEDHLRAYGIRHYRLSGDLAAALASHAQNR